MASLYEINEEILKCLDLETGEILDIEKFDTLQIEREQKIENIALWHKNLLSEADQYKNEKNSFAEKEKRARNTAESLKNYLDKTLNGNKFSTIKVAISYRKSSSIEYDGITKLPDEFLKYSEPTVDKTAVKNAIVAGKEVNGCKIVESNNIQIK